MLINKGMEAGEVVTIKTTAGEEIIAKFVEENVMNVTVVKPRCLTSTREGIALVPFLFTTDPAANVTISKNTIMVLAPSFGEAKDNYLEATSGIKLR
jgi:hypothetical protein